jgi:hypothetical protein
MDGTNLPYWIQISEFQTAAGVLTSRIIEQIRRQSPKSAPANHLMTQKL